VIVKELPAVSQLPRQQKTAGLFGGGTDTLSRLALRSRSTPRPSTSFCCLILQGYLPAFLPVRLQYNTSYRVIARSFFPKVLNRYKCTKKAGSHMRSGLKS